MYQTPPGPPDSNNITLTGIKSVTDLPHLAIDAALELRWDDAKKINSEIIKMDPENVDALNRLARAYFELGDLSEAKKYYSLAVKHDPYNPIALKNLKIIQSTKAVSNGYQKGDGNGHYIIDRISPTLFLQEPGKTKIVSLIKVAEPQKLSHTYCGMGVVLTIKNRGISVMDTGGTYLGALPDDTAHELLRLIKGGNKYQAFIKGIRPNGLLIMLRETFRSRKFKNQASFLDYISNPISPDILPKVEESNFTDEETLEEE